MDVHQNLKGNTMPDIAYVARLPKCDFCAEAGIEKDATHDTRTVLGPWASVCDYHLAQYGVGRLGTGYGQRYIVGDRPPVTDDERRARVAAALKHNSMSELEDAVGDGDIADYL